MKVIFALLVGFGVGAAAFWFYQEHRKGAKAHPVAARIENSASSAGQAIQAQLRVLNLRAEDVKEDLAKSGKVVRRKAQETGQAIADATADARTTATIKGKLLASRDLSALSISVNTTAGVVTLSGAVSSHEDIGKAVLLAMQTDGVREVISTLQVRPAQPPAKP